MNKNISIWRGSNTPPTLNHLWIDEANNIKINVNNEWVSLLEIILKQWDNIVTLEDTQTITGDKTFTSPINLNNYSIIKSSTNSGEFKVTHCNSEKGFIIRTNWSDDKNILPLEILSIDGDLAFHLYKFPEKSGTLLVDSDIQSFKDDINNIENNVIPKAVVEGIAQVVANAPEDLDTLKEVADYIASDKTKANQIETAISNLQKKDKELQTAIEDEVASSEQMYESLLSSITTAKNDMRSSTPIFDKVVTGEVTLAMGSATTNYQVVYLEDKKMFAALNAGKYWANWLAWGKYPSAVSYGPAPAVGKVYIMGNALYVWNGNSLNEIGDFDDIKKSIAHNTGAIANNVQAIDLLAEEVETKAPKVGYAPDLKVDFAKELVGRGVADPQEIGTIRPTGVISIGDGNATIEKVKGKSVVWNQLAQQPSTEFIPPAINYYRAYRSTDLSKVDVKHRYLAVIKVVCTDASGNHPTLTCGLFNGKNAGSFDTSWYAIFNTNETYSHFFQPKESNYTTFGFFCRFLDNGGSVVHNDQKWTMDIQVHDLTQMFGVGNEPTTIEEFEARKPLGVSDDYNEGEIISYDGANELQSVGFNAFNGTYAKVIGGQQYHALGTITSIGFTTELGGETTEVTLDSEGMFTPSETGYVYAEGSDICIHLTHTYTPEHTTEYEEDILTLPDVKSIKDKDGNPLFPYGLLSAGSAYDEITAKKAVKRIGVVDLGGKVTGMIAQREGKFLYSASIPNIAKGFLNVKMQAIVNSAKYTVGTQQDWPNYINIISSYNGTNGRVIVSSAIEGVASINEDLQGVILYYELETPIEVDLAEPLNLTYEAWDFGTEELIAEGATTPLNAVIGYQFNAVDRIRENSSAIDDLEEHVEERKNDGIELLTNGNLKLTLKGDTREFMPATPSGDPMHYAYVSAGAEYNDSGADIIKTGFYGDKIIHKAGYWCLNEIGDLSTQEMAEIYSERWPSKSVTVTQYFWKSNSRTVWIYLTSDSNLTNYLFYYSPNIEKLKLAKDNTSSIRISGNPMASIIGLRSLTKILTVLNVNNATSLTAWFDSCPALEEVRISGLKCNISFKVCSNISKASVKYIIEKAAPTSAITITLHADAYARLAEDADIVAALETKPLVTLVSA